MTTIIGTRTNRIFLVMGLVCAITLTAGIAPDSAAAKGVTVTWATINGFFSDYAKQMIEEYEVKTGNKVKIINIDYAQLYEKQVIEMVGGTGAYDIITYESVWKPEFVAANWLQPLDEFIAKADQDDLAIKDIAPALTELSTGWKGKTYGLPYYTFTMGYFYRYDLFTDPTEQGAFQAKFGYELSIPKTYEQMADIAQFFTRKKGEKLKGKVLDKPMYGIGLMAGRFPQIQDEIMSIVWTKGGQLIKDDGTPGTMDAVFLESVDLYVNKLLPYAPPGATSSGFPEIVGQMNQGMIAQTAAYYIDQWPNMRKTEDLIPGAEVGCAPSPGAHTWVGAFTLGLSKDSKNPQAAFDFMAYLTGKKGQRAFVDGSKGSTSRLSILSDPEVYKPNRNSVGHFPVLLQILDHNDKAKFYPNQFYVEQSGKIYDEETTFFSAAASKQTTIEEAMTSLGKAIEKHCRGNCNVQNDHLGENYHPTPTPFEFDSSVWMNK
jgi:multiple sugar transport system substrate-binding protein